MKPLTTVGQFNRARATTGQPPDEHKGCSAKKYEEAGRHLVDALFLLPALFVAHSARHLAGCRKIE
jgi:hypothetical protein